MAFDERKVTVSKLSAAKRQLDCAIDLWFRGADEVSIHTLAAAAYQIIHDIVQKRGIATDLLYDSVVVKDEYRSQWVAVIKKPMNFFKHADKDPDPDTSIEFPTFGAIVYFLFSIRGLGLLDEKDSDLTAALTMWLTIHDSSVITSEYRSLFINAISAAQLDAIRGLKKLEFLEMFLKLRSNIEK